jgi:hypothetical protein
MDPVGTRRVDNNDSNSSTDPDRRHGEQQPLQQHRDMTQPVARDWHPQAEIHQLATLNINLNGNGNGNSNDNGSSSAAPFRYDYAVEDVYTEQSVPPDAWAKYLRTRFTKRKRQFQDHGQTEQDLIRKEVRRIRYFREHFKDYRIAASDRLPLVALLDDSRTKWRDLAFNRVAAELAACDKRLERSPRDPQQLRNRAILSQVQQWRTKDYAAARDSMHPDAYMPDLETGPESEDDPRKPDYGYNGWVIAWEEGRGWVSLDHPLVHGKFPHQKISIQQFLYNKAETPLRRSDRKDQLRYFHLPANNMKWVEVRLRLPYEPMHIPHD